MIIAIKEKDKIVLGMSICDDSIDMTERDLALPENLPFWKVKGEKDCYVCTEDLTFSSDLLRYNDSVFKDIFDGKSIMEKVVPKMKELLNKHNCSVDGKEWRNRMLILKDNKIFAVDSYFSVTEIDEFIAFGYGKYLLGALEATGDLDSEERILNAVGFLKRMRNRELFPLIIFDTKNKKRKVFYR